MKDVKRFVDPYSTPKIGLLTVGVFSALAVAITILRGRDEYLWELFFVAVCVTPSAYTFVQFGKLSKPGSLKLADTGRGTEAMVLAYDAALSLVFAMMCAMALF